TMSALGAKPDERCSLRAFPLLTRTRLRRPAFAAMRAGLTLLYLARDPWPWGTPHEAARVHHPAWRRGGLANGCEGAAAQGHASHWRAHGRVWSGLASTPRDIPEGAGTIGLDRWPKRAARNSPGRWRCRRHTQACDRIGGA